MPAVRRPRFTQQQMIQALTDGRGLVTHAARQLRCDRGTVENYVARYPAVRAALQQARDAHLDDAEGQLFGAIDRGDPWAIQFFLRTIGRRRGYGEHVQLDATVDVLQTPEWLRTRARLLGVLRAFPDAQTAVVRALEGPAPAPGDDVDAAG